MIKSYLTTEFHRVSSPQTCAPQSFTVRALNLEP